MDETRPAHGIKPRWGRRVTQAKLRRLYEGMASGIGDDELLDDVGFTLYVRCRSVLTILDIFDQKRLPCPSCLHLIQLNDSGWSWDNVEYSLHCAACDWTMRWGDYWATFRHQELWAAGARDMFAEFVAGWQAAQSSRDKILAVDRVIHQWHWETREERPGSRLGRPTGANLIEGNRKDVIAFLDTLTYGDRSPDEARATRDTWRDRLREVRERQAVDRDALRARRVNNGPLPRGRRSREGD